MSIDKLSGVGWSEDLRKASSAADFLPCLTRSIWKPWRASHLLAESHDEETANQNHPAVLTHAQH